MEFVQYRALFGLAIKEYICLLQNESAYLLTRNYEISGIM